MDPAAAKTKKHLNHTTVHVSRTVLGILSALLIAAILGLAGSFFKHGNEMARQKILVDQHETKLQTILPATERQAAQYAEIIRRLERIENKQDRLENSGAN